MRRGAYAFALQLALFIATPASVHADPTVLSPVEWKADLEPGHETGGVELKVSAGGITSDPTIAEGLGRVPVEVRSVVWEERVAVESPGPVVDGSGDLRLRPQRTLSRTVPGELTIPPSFHSRGYESASVRQLDGASATALHVWAIADLLVRTNYDNYWYVVWGCPDCEVGGNGEPPPSDPFEPTWEAIHRAKAKYRGVVFGALDAARDGLLLAKEALAPPLLELSVPERSIPVPTKPLPAEEIVVPIPAVAPQLDLRLSLAEIETGLDDVASIRPESASGGVDREILSRSVEGVPPGRLVAIVQSSQPTVQDPPVPTDPPTVVSAPPIRLVPGAAETGAHPPGPAAAFSAAVLALALALALLPLLHRIRSNESLLSHAIRRSIYQFAAERDGVTASEISRQFGISDTTAAYHLRLLQKHGLLSSQAVGKRILFHLNGSGRTGDEHRARYVLQKEPARGLLQAVAQNPQISLRGLARACGLTISGVYWYVNRLEEQGLLVTRREPRRGIAYVVLPVARELLARRPEPEG